MKIAVLCGGLSPERDVSLSSARLVCQALRSLGHKAVLVDVFFGLEGEALQDPAQLFEKLPELKEARVDALEPDLEKVRASRLWKSPSAIGQGVLELCQTADLVFMGLHGTCGEDGRLQAMFDLLGIPYTGSGHLGSAIAMDKHYTKQVLKQAGIRTPDWRLITYGDAPVEQLADGIPLPCVVKPVDSGSSVGVAIARSQQELTSALRANAAYGRVLVEQYISGREMDVAVLEGRALPPIEIIPQGGFYDYYNKYQAGAAKEICPADIPEDVDQQLRSAALQAHQALGLLDYSRSDFKLDENGDIWFLEINTLPGMTPTSLVPQEAAAAGISYEELCEKIVELAMKRVKA